jgi:enoyl-[acyl-carrier protein] reductase I
VQLLEGKRVLVTGVANRWSIATGIARQLHAHGATLAFTYQGERVRDSVAKIAAELGGGPVVECDVSDDASLARAREEIVGQIGKLDGIIHSIAFVKKEDLSGTVYETSRSGFNQALDISSYSLIALVNAFHHDLNDGASVIALTYLGATQIVPNYNIAGISKAALESIVRYLAFDLGGRGIRVNAISAGPISTASSRQVGGFSRILDVVPKVAPLRRNVTSEDVGDAAVYLISDLSKSVTADVHFVDSGYHAMGLYPVEAGA